MVNQSSKASGSLTGGILLVAGCCIGAGMLGLPVLSGLAGFIPSVFLFFICWAFMVSTGLLLLEVNLWFKDEVSIISMADRTLGTVGKIIGWAGFLFLFYALMVAYISGTGELIADFAVELTGVHIFPWQGSLLCCALFGVMIYLGTRAVDWFNRLLMIGLVVAYFLLIVMGGPHVNTSLLTHSDWSAAYLVIPALILSFGYHNLVPTLTTYLQRDIKRLRLSIIIGSSIPLVIYLTWEWLILGLIPIEGEGGFRQALGQGDMATQALKNAIGSSWITDIAQYFAFFAIVTSFLGVALSFVDFLSDGLHVKKDVKGKILLCALVILLPLAFALSYPKVFLMALSYAGSYGAVTLFGILPAAMVWGGRYYRKIDAPRLLPGGRTALVVIVIFALAVMLLQTLQDI